MHITIPPRLILPHFKHQIYLTVSMKDFQVSTQAGFLCHIDLMRVKPSFSAQQPNYGNLRYNYAKQSQFGANFLYYRTRLRVTGETGDFHRGIISISPIHLPSSGTFQRLLSFPSRTVHEIEVVSPRGQRHDDQQRGTL